jgi:FkbM family methyltransferase
MADIEPKGMSNLRIILKCLAFPLYSLFSSRIGFSVFLPTLNGWWLFTRGKYIPINGHPGVSSLEYFRHFVPEKGKIVFDVGGELGFETRQFSMMVGDGGKVFTFECFPEHISRLKELSKSYPNIHLVEKACWNKSQKLKFYKGHTPGSNTALTGIKGLAGQPLANEESEAFMVDAETLDEMWNSLTREAPVDFLKMDIEGAEIEALNGASNLLQKTNKVVVAAYHERDGVKTAEEVSQILAKSGFTVRVDENYHVYGVKKT